MTTMADAKYDAFIRIDMLADKIERKLNEEAAATNATPTSNIKDNPDD